MAQSKYPHAGSVFSTNLAELMRKAGDTTTTLAAAIGRNPSSVTHWLTGRVEPRLEMVDMIAVRYGVDPLWLAGIHAYEEPEEEPMPVIQGVPHDMIELAASADMAPTIPEGAHVFITKTAIIPSGSVAYLMVNGETMFRRVFRDDKTITLTADNPLVKPMVFTGAKKKQIEVIGKATRVIYELE